MQSYPPFVGGIVPGTKPVDVSGREVDDGSRKCPRNALLSPPDLPASKPHAGDCTFDPLTFVVAAPHTKWNIVCDIARREVRFRSVASPTVKHLSLRAFDLSCEAPLS